jgi:glyoxylase-like metal-dependent hydrolase (beta-lactamase superfamily II)
MMQLGKWRLDTVHGGYFLLDAGVMYGVVPKSVWQKITPADEQNRIPFAIHCLLARDGQQTVLLDTGYGGKLSPLDRSSHGIEPGDPLVESLATLGVAPEQINAVVFTHLHWDHIGGATRLDEGRQTIPTFPNAVHYINRWEWEDATSGAPELAGSYTIESLQPLADAKLVTLVDGETEVLPGLWTRVTGGHTRGHQAILLESEGQVAIYPGDLVPVTTHLRRMWCAAYDYYPLDTRRRKPELLGAAADGGWWILWDHDPAVAVSQIERHRTREFVVVDGRPAC